MKLQKSIIALLAVFVFAVTANAQFGDLIKKAKDKVDKATKQVNTETNTGTTKTGTNVNTSIGGRGGCGTARASGPPIGSQPLNERTPGCPNFIGLSKSPIDANNLKAAQFTTEFKAGDPIYGIIFTDGALKNWAQPKALEDDVKQITLNLDAGKEEGDENTSFFGGELSSSATISVTPEIENRNYATFAFIPSPAAAMSNDDVTNGYFFIERVKEIKRPSKLYASVQMVGWSPSPRLAPIVLDLSGGTQPYLTMKSQLNKGMAKVLGADKVTLPTAGMKNPQLQNKIMTMENALPGASKLLRVIITSSDWTPVRHEVTGVLIGRAIGTVVIIKDAEGVCTQQPRSYTENYNGRSYTGLHHSGTQRETIMACENVMK